VILIVIFFSFFFATLLTWAQSGRDIFLICDNLTTFWNDIDNQNFLLARMKCTKKWTKEKEMVGRYNEKVKKSWTATSSIFSHPIFSISHQFLYTNLFCTVPIKKIPRIIAYVIIIISGIHLNWSSKLTLKSRLRMHHLSVYREKTETTSKVRLDLISWSVVQTT
jgi:hypothetical protein